MHRDSSLRRAFNIALAIGASLIALGTVTSASAQGLGKKFYGFEGDQSGLARLFEGLTFEGDSGVDVNQGFAYMGQNNGWLGSAASWNAITKDVGAIPRTATWCNFNFQQQNSGNGSPLSVPPLVARIIDTQTGEVYYEQVITVGLYAYEWTGFGTFNNWVKTSVNGASGQLPLGRRLSVQLGYLGDGFGSWIRVDNLIWECFE
jgi:hypothetical protein